jgi:hypothetical protein
MHKLAVIAAASVLFLGAASAETRNLSGFEGVRAEGRFDVSVTVGGQYSVTITGPDADRLRTEIDDGELMVETRNRPWFGDEPRVNADVVITTPRLNSLVSARGADLEATNVSADSFSMVAAMGGEVRAAGTCQNLDASASMGGSVRVDGAPAHTNISTSMGGGVSLR